MREGLGWRVWCKAPNTIHDARRDILIGLHNLQSAQCSSGSLCQENADISPKATGEEQFILLLQGEPEHPISQSYLLSCHWLPGSLGQMPGNTKHYRTWSPRSLILHMDCQHSCSHWYTLRRRILSTWAPAHNGLDLGKEWGMLIMCIGTFNCKECLGRTRGQRKWLVGLKDAGHLKCPCMCTYAHTHTYTNIHTPQDGTATPELLYPDRDSSVQVTTKLKHL